MWLGHQFSQSGSSPAVLEFTPPQIAELEMGGSPIPALSVMAGFELSISAIVFDEKGNLWIAAQNPGGDPNGVDGGTLEMFQVAGKSGALSQPDVTITPASISSINQSLDEPSGLAFDGQGSLWVSNRLSSDQVSGSRNSTGFLVKFKANQLIASGSPVPSVVINPNRKASNLQNPTTVIFGSTAK
jgi:secreted PhoX family phosphatase